jgi:hypothetical protein
MVQVCLLLCPAVILYVDVSVNRTADFVMFF